MKEKNKFYVEEMWAFKIADAMFDDSIIDEYYKMFVLTITVKSIVLKPHQLPSFKIKPARKPFHTIINI